MIQSKTSKSYDRIYNTMYILLILLTPNIQVPVIQVPILQILIIPNNPEIIDIDSDNNINIYLNIYNI